MSQIWKLVGPDGKPYASAVPGTLGGHRRNRIYGRLDCPAALRAIARGGYVTHRVFFLTEEDTAGRRLPPLRRLPPHCLCTLESTARQHSGYQAASCGKTEAFWANSSGAACGVTARSQTIINLKEATSESWRSNSF